MKANFRTCPQCSTRNRLDKEFCVKCGEPLEGVKAGDGTASKKGKPGFFVTSEDEGQSPMVPLVFVILTLGVVFAGWRYVSQTPGPDLPTPVAKVVTTPLPVTTPNPGDPGAADYLAGMDALRATDFPKALRLLRQAVA
ncbi:MAG: zinc ribbon domain-containing protein, partial [Vicinamibacteria bacterium]